MRKEELRARLRDRVAGLDPKAKEVLRRLTTPRLRGVVLWGSFRRTEPFSEIYGYDRGTPIDRRMIADFLHSRADDIKGHVLEVREDFYARWYGRGVIETSVLDVDPLNGKATVLADLGEPGSLPTERYDCVIVTQTLQYVGDPKVALQNLHDSLVPGGTLLVTVPCVSRLDPDAGYENDLWRFTPAGLLHLLRVNFPEPAVSSLGNCLTAASFVMGLAAEELSEAELTLSDPAFPVLVCARATRA